MNPYGIGLHRHVAGYLTSDWIRNAVDEFQSPQFRSENLLHFELLLLGALLLAGSLVARRRVADALVILLWAHFALGSVRHVPVFAIVAGPLLAGGTQRPVGALGGGRGRRGRSDAFCTTLGQDLRPSFQRLSVLVGWRWPRRPSC